MNKHLKHFGCGFFSLLVLFSACQNGDSQNAPKILTTTSLPRSVPEAEGVSSEGIIAFLDSAAAVTNLELHSFIFLRHGKVIAEGSWDPYKPSLVHTMNSCSKIFCSTAMGFAISEKRLKLDDKVISFFPNDLPETVSPYLAQMTVRDLLTMSSGITNEPNWIRATTNWVKGYLTSPITYEPGTRFQYSSLGSYMVGAIVTKATGQKLMDYLKPRLFDPLSVEGIDWDTDSQGINTGGSGLRVKIEDMAKLGQLYLQNGKWNGKQILSPEWIKEATTFKIDQAPNAEPSVKTNSDWMQGYGYQFWRCRNNAFRGDGSGGQFIIVMPEQDAVVAIQAETLDMQGELDLVWKYLLPAIKDGKLPANSATTNLKQKLLSLALPLPGKGIDSKIAAQISGKIFTFKTNGLHLKSLSFSFKDGICQTTLKTDTAKYELTFGADKWIGGETALPKSNFLQPAKTTGGGYVPQPDGSLRFRDDGQMLQKVVGGYGWKNDDILELVLHYVESPSAGGIICQFDGKKISVTVKFSNDAKVSQPASGEIQ